MRISAATELIAENHHLIIYIYLSTILGQSGNVKVFMCPFQFSFISTV